MDFRDYYKNKVSDELEGMVQLQEPVQTTEVGCNSAVASVVSSYAKDTNLKIGFSALATDLGEQIFKYLTEQFVKREDFDSDDGYAQFIQNLRVKVAEGYNKNLYDVLRNIGVYAENQKNLSAK